MRRAALLSLVTSATSILCACSGASTANSPPAAIDAGVDAYVAPIDASAAIDAASSSNDAANESSTAAVDAGDIYQEIYNAVDANGIWAQLQNITGYNAVTVGGSTFKISERYSVQGKANFRLYFREYFESLGMQVNVLDYPSAHSVLFPDPDGHNLEAVLPGKSADSIVLIVHYDSRGPIGLETTNPAVDDDMTGMAIMWETARLLSLQYAGRFQHTIRFVAADFEEWPWPNLEGSTKYGEYIDALAKANNFQLVAAVDHEQAGWNCFVSGGCMTNTPVDTLDVYDCSPDGTYSFPALGMQMGAIATKYSNLAPNYVCDGDDSDQYSMWVAGIPAVEFGEHDPLSNPHYDVEGGDTLDRIDQAYFTTIARIGVTFDAQLAGME